MIDSDEARDRGLGGPRGCMICLPIMGFLILAAIVVFHVVKHHS